jgi:hypothetical protein
MASSPQSSSYGPRTHGAMRWASSSSSSRHMESNMAWHAACAFLHCDSASHVQ